MNLHEELEKVWEDQRAFNLLFRPTPRDPAEMATQARDFVLLTGSELHELLRTLPWKKHRRMPFRANNAHMLEEGIDVFKCALSLLQIIGIDSWEKLIELYWQKTSVVRQRYREEWVNKLDGPCVVVDIDNVICDYVTGIGQWIQKQSIEPEVHYRIEHLIATGGYISANSLGVPEETWQAWKHQFRTSGAKRRLPIYNDARMFLHRMKADGLRVVLLTSRPIDLYPNLFTDTLLCLEAEKLPFDFIWWSADKAERLLQEEGLKEHIKFAVDDDVKFVNQFSHAGIPVYWLDRNGRQRAQAAGNPNIIVVHSLDEIRD